MGIDFSSDMHFGLHKFFRQNPTIFQFFRQKKYSQWGKFDPQKNPLTGFLTKIRNGKDMFFEVGA